MHSCIEDTHTNQYKVHTKVVYSHFYPSSELHALCGTYLEFNIESEDMLYCMALRLMIVR